MVDQWVTYLRLEVNSGLLRALTSDCQPQCEARTAIYGVSQQELNTQNLYSSDDWIRRLVGG